jgi:hypothetical protein
MKADLDIAEPAEGLNDLRQEEAEAILRETAAHDCAG